MNTRVPTRFARALASFCLPIVVWGGWAAAALADAGQAIYENKCASCHGPRGEGVSEKYEDPLHGELSIEKLAEVIDKTMPLDAADQCSGEDAQQVAAYIHGAFYSPEARGKQRSAEPRIDLARLTVPQYRNAVADLVARFTPPPEEDEKHKDDAEQPGLRAEYFQSKGMSKADELKEDRVDARVDFDFGEGSPTGDIDATQFAIVWEGSLVARDTGYYEFRITTPNGARLYLNNVPTERSRKLRDDSSVAGQAALIDGWVSSGENRSLEARVFLLGGRRYPLRLEFFKYKEKAAAVRMEWKPPYGAWSVLDAEHLVTAASTRLFVIDTPFPADDRSLGYERGSAVSQGWHEAAVSAAVATAAEVVARLPLLTGVDEKAADRQERAGDFLARFAGTAFRRPLSEDEQQWFREGIFAASPTLEAAVRRAVVLVLASPHFLYTDLTPPSEAPSQYTIATRLALALWDSIPDDALREAAATGQLATREGIEAQARRMIDDPRAQAKMRRFFRHWLELDERDLAKDKTLFPEFDEAVVADLRRSLELFVEGVVWSDASDYRELLLADYLVLNDRLAELYRPDVVVEAPAGTDDEGEDPGQAASAARQGAEAAAEADAEASADEPSGEAKSSENTESAGDKREPRTTRFERVVFSPERRAGVLTHPYLLSAFAYHNSTSPIHRGVFLTRNIVGRELNPPPVAVAFNNEEFPADLTMREKITQLTRDKACMACHSIINPLGFALENFDAVGRWRTEENDRPVDARSEYKTEAGEALSIASARDVANFAVARESASRAFVADVFHHLVKQDTAAYGPDTLDALRADFAADGYNIRNLWVTIAALAAGHGYDSTSLSPEDQP